MGEAILTDKKLVDVLEKKAKYLFTIKENQPRLRGCEIRDTVASTSDVGTQSHALGEKTRRKSSNALARDHDISCSLRVFLR
jgi:hypothetical protein